MRAMVPMVTSRVPAKVIALKLGNIPPRTVQNWQTGASLPSAYHWEELKRLFPEFEAKSREWSAEALGVDPLDETRLLYEVQKLLQRRALNGGGK